MHIKNVQVRHFRSIENSGLADCGGLNVLIGKNNAGKSNLLAAIETSLRHLKRGLIAVILSRRAIEQFTDRDNTKPYRIAVEFELPPDVNENLRERLSKEAPHLDRSIEQIKTNNSIVFVFAAASDNGDSWLFLEQIVVGSLSPNGEELKIEGIRLLSVPSAVAKELAHTQQRIGEVSGDIKRLQDLAIDRRWAEFVVERKDRFRSYTEPLSGMTRGMYQEVESAVSNSSSADSLLSAVSRLAVDAQQYIDNLKKKETAGSINAFAGPTKLAPAYALWLMEEYGAIQLLHLQETKAPIGKDEADTLLDMKLQRGGMEQLQTLQQTIRALLGVSVDAFGSRERGGSRTAEMDVDNFLVEANGAGIRESLRLILDLEIKKPQLLLAEEPEVHLHPGLARVIATYLRDKSTEVQMFVTTHSTEFVDSVAFQNAYLVSRDTGYKTICQAVTAAEGPLLLPAELGLRLSTVFMFDRLVFVEGPSDESVLRTIAKTLALDLTKSNVGFVHMCGVRNFAHFAAEGTLDLLSRRQISMWFITDRDEQDDQDVKRMVERLGRKASLKVLRRRELENYLLDATAVRAFLRDKQLAAGSAPLADNDEAVSKIIAAEGLALKDEVIRLRLGRRLLSPVFMNVRTAAGNIEEKLNAALALLRGRLDKLQEETASVTKEVSEVWAEQYLDLAPGTLVMEKVARRYGTAFSKDKGDSERLAQNLQHVPYELENILKEITREEEPRRAAAQN